MQLKSQLRYVMLCLYSFCASFVLSQFVCVMTKV